MKLTALRMNRLEVWNSPQCAGGSRLAFLPDVVRCDAVVQVTPGGDTLSVAIPLGSPAIAEVIEHRILRVWQNDAQFDEWVIDGIAKDADNEVLEISCESIESLLGRRVRPVGSIAGGMIAYDFEIVGRKPSEIWTETLAPAFTADGLTWLALGTVDEDLADDYVLSWLSPLELLQLIGTQRELTLQLRRNGTADYKVDLLQQLGAAAPALHVRYGVNLAGSKLTTTVRQQATRVFPSGASDGERRATMARAVWKVAGVAGLVITLADPAGGDGPIAFDDQIVGAYLRKVDGSLTQVTDSSAAAQTVTVASATGIATNNLIQFRANAGGDDLTWLDSPLDVAAYGVVVGQPQFDEVPGTNNVIPNPALRDWPSGALPVGYTAIGAPTTSKETTAPFFRTGPHSLKVIAAAAGQGVKSPAGAIVPSANSPFVAGFPSFRITSGQVRAELEFTTGGGPVIVPVTIAKSSELGQWVDVVIEGEDANAIAATAVAVRIIAHEGAATFHVDRVQASEGAAALPFVEGSGGTRLWQRANQELKRFGAPPATFDVQMIDVVGDGQLPELGGAVMVVDGRISSAFGGFGSRIAALKIDYRRPRESQITVSDRPEDLTGFLTISDRVRSRAIVGTTDDTLGPSLDVRATPGASDFTITYVVNATSFQYSIDGAAYTTVPASPFVVTRPAAGANDKTLSFRAIKDGQTIEDTITIPAIDKDTFAADLAVVQTAQNDSTSSFQATTSNPGSGASVTLRFTLVNCTAQGYSGAGPHVISSGTTVVVNRPSMSAGQATITFESLISGQPTERVSRTVPGTVYDPASDPENLLTNGGGQIGTVNTLATGWSNPIGNGVQVADDFSKFGDRSLRIVNATALQSQSYVIIEPPTTMCVYELSGWIKADAAASQAPKLIIANQFGQTIEIIDAVGLTGAPDASTKEVYHGTGTYDFTLVRMRFRSVGSGAFRLYVTLGDGGVATTGSAWFDGLILKRLIKEAPNLTVTPVEGATSVTINYTVDSDATFEYSTDNGAFVSVPASGFTVTRNAAGGATKKLTFRATRASQTKVVVVEVPPQVAAPPPTAPTFTSVNVVIANDGTDTGRVTWAVSNAPAGEKYNVWLSEAGGGWTLIGHDLASGTTQQDFQSAFNLDLTPPGSDTVNEKAYVVMTKDQTVVATSHTVSVNLPIDTAP